MTRRLAAFVLAAALALPTFAPSPAAADPTDLVHTEVNVAASDGSGDERVCVGVDDPDGQSTTWVCSPEAQWYAQMIAYAKSLIPV